MPGSMRSRFSPPPHLSLCGAAALALGSLLVLGGCASSPATSRVGDRLERINRPLFALDQEIDDDALGPVARGWIRITPQQVRDAISDAYHNLTFPDRFVSSLGEGELRMAGAELARFLINSTFGIAGVLDPASVAGIPKYDEDIGKMLTRWGVPPGPYVVIPLVGPSTPRDVAGGIFDLALNPLTWAGMPGIGLGALFAINGRAQEEPEIQAAKRAAIDYYAFVRDAYFERRTAAPETDAAWWEPTDAGAADLIRADASAHAFTPLR
jgi:phospholipid-binding lipoprotein MlaA